MTSRLILCIRSLAQALGVACIVTLAVPVAGTAQQQSNSHTLAPGDARVLLLPAAMYNAQANLQESTDSAKAAIATATLDSVLGQALGGQVVSGDAALAELAKPEVARAAGYQPCNVLVSCARAAAKAAATPWVVMVKVSKTSNLIWLLTGQLIYAPTGRVVLDDSTELKGEPDRMVRIGTRIFAERVARTVQAGGAVNNFPNGVPSGA
ncbi:MAG TPA: DUF2380 domain-containing protein [Gemmatimonadales bacterium]|nr:DUF2380 domain-containing protein [Gemmatimonadales bacterium]